MFIESVGGSQFKLTKTLLRGYVRGRADGYYTSRKQIAKAFRGALQVPYAWKDSRHKINSTMFEAQVLHSKTDEAIFIGCQAFIGGSYLALRRWALGRKK